MMLQVMDQPEHGSVTEEETYSRFRSRVGSRKLLVLLHEFHGEVLAEIEDLPPHPLAPIPNEVIAEASEIAFPDWVNIVTRIKSAVCKEFNISAVDLVSHRRLAKHLIPRQVAMYLCRKITTKSLPEIARRFGGRDHTTALHAVNKIEKRIETDAPLRARVTMLAELFGGSIA